MISSRTPDNVFLAGGVYRKGEMSLLLANCIKGGHAPIQRSMQSRRIFETYESFCRAVGECVMLFKASVLVEDAEAVYHAHALELEATRTQQIQGLLTAEESGLQNQASFQRLNTRLYQFPEMERHAGHGYDIAYTQMFQLTRLTPAQLVLFSLTN
jgi:hypothetical protein